MGVKSTTKVAPLRLTSVGAQRRIRRLAEDSRNVIITRHAKERMRQRDIDSRDVHTILRTGYVEDAPAKEPRGGWHCKVTKKLSSGGRTAGAVTVITVNDKLIVVTVEWEDRK